MAFLARPLLLGFWALSVLSPAATAGSFSSVVVYGDSLSDNGNLFAAVGFPPAPYFEGRRSDGPVAVELLASRLNAPLFDFAWIGATTGLGNFGDLGTTTTAGLIGLPGMAKTFLETQPLLAPFLAQGLFVVWGGPNDFLAPSPLDDTPEKIIARGVGNLIAIVGALQGMGAQNILVPGMPDLGLTPYFRSLGPLASAQASFATDAFNAALRGNLPAGVGFYDTAALMRSVVANPAAYGFTNVQSACFDGVTVCDNPAEYMFWDDFHPTTATHAILASEFRVAAIPEPSAVLLAATGLALGAIFRKRLAARA